jgi:UDP-N-acetylglucosamine:LPS N-acetylglucosamine transferase
MVKPKILILTIPVGGGHDATARVMAHALAKRLGNSYDIEVANILKIIGGIMPLDRLAAESYAGSVKTLNAYPYRLFFNFLNTNPKLANKFFSTVLKPGMTRFFRRQKPILIISTFPVLSFAASQIIKSEGWTVPLVSIITDAGDVHKLWLMGVEDALLVATPDTKQYAIKQGVPADRVFDLGFPIAPEYSQLPTKQMARKQLGLPDKLTILVTSGGMGMSPGKFLRLAKLLAKLEIDAQLLLVCGKNESLKQQVMELSYRPYVQVFGFVDNMPTLMAAADLVVGKAGWITLSETMVARRPTIIMDVIPGQEEPNAQYVTEHGVGLVLTNPRLVVDKIVEFYEYPDRLQPYEKALNRLAFPANSSEKIVDFITDKFIETKNPH